MFLSCLASQVFAVFHFMYSRILFVNTEIFGVFHTNKSSCWVQTKSSKTSFINLYHYISTHTHTCVCVCIYIYIYIYIYTSYFIIKNFNAYLLCLVNHLTTDSPIIITKAAGFMFPNFPQDICLGQLQFPFGS